MATWQHGYKILTGDALAMLKTLPAVSAQMCVTSPPYWGLRDYGISGQLGLEPTVDLYVNHIVEIFREVRRVLKDDGTLWLNMGDCYATGGGKANIPGGGYRGAHDGDAKRPKWSGPYQQPNRIPQSGLKPKDLAGLPWRVAFALQADGWWLRSDIIWHKTNPMPESVTDRPTKSHEYLFLLSKSARYLYNADAIKEPTTGSSHDRARKERSADGQKTLPTGERNGMRAPGVNPKAQKWPNAWSAEEGQHDGVGNGRYRPSGNKERNLAGPANGRLETHMGSGIPWPPSIRPKQNESFSAALVRTVERRNKRTVWTISTKPFSGAHFATFPPKLVEPCILAGSRPGDIVLDPFNGAGTSGLVATAHGRRYLGIELNPAYVEMTHQRLQGKPLAATA
jgi:site-specific DNA-methyltransferase (cytosine-N4-specific)